jgi:hypothetical protein
LVPALRMCLAGKSSFHRGHAGRQFLLVRSLGKRLVAEGEVLEI